jgi:hypothetical protein
MSLPPPPPGPPPPVTSANSRPPGPPPSFLASIQQKGGATSPPPPPPPSGSQGNTPNGGKGGFNTNLLQRAANSNTHNKDNSDSDWSEDESVHEPIPVVTNNISIKPAVSKPPVHSKPPPARPNSGYVAPPPPAPTTTPSVVKSLPPPPPPPTGSQNANNFDNKTNNSAPPPPLQIKLPPPPAPAPTINNSRQVESSPGPPGPPKRQSIKLQDNSEELAKLKTELKELMAQIGDKDDIISSLEEELTDNKRKLADAEGKLAAALVKNTTDTRSAAAIAASASSNSRESELGRELDSAYNRINELKGEKMQLESSIKALTVRLTLTESKLEATVQKQSNSVLNFESTFKKSDREATLETQLVKAKRDKDKAVRLVILLIGKEKVAEFLRRHAGAPDILDKLIESYGSGKFNDSVSVTPQTQRNTSTSFAFDTRFKESIANDILKYGN